MELTAIDAGRGCLGRGQAARVPHRDGHRTGEQVASAQFIGASSQR